jgi:Leucine-rich repeat (LRR) protein
MFTASACPPREVYERVLSGMAADDVVEAASAHLEGCPACLETFRGLYLQDTVVAALDDGPLTAPCDADELERLVERILRPDASPGGATRSFAEPGDGTSPADDVATAPHAGSWQQWLGPAEAPDELGRLGGYRVLRVLGAGGMGVVFEAEDVQLLRRVALKAMRPELAASEEARRRFLREARMMAALQHDHVVTIHYVGADRGLPFLTMPVLRGESLEARLRRAGALPPAEVLRIGREVAEGLQAAHARGMVHRDVKPSNVWLEEPGGRVKVLDFGLARLAEGDSALSASRVMAGTPAYMAPEQARGEAVDARSDLFALGATLYQMCTGTSPFLKNNAPATLHAVTYEDPPPPAKLNPAVSAALSAVVMRLLRKASADRPASAGEVAEALRAAERPAPEEVVRPRPGGDRGRRRPRALTRGMIALAVGSAVVFAGIVLVIKRKDGTTQKIELRDDDEVKIIGTPDRVAKPEASDGPASAGDADRRAAEWALSLGGKVEVRAGDEERTIQVARDLPAGPFQVLGIWLLRGKPVTDAGLTHLEPLTKLRTLSLEGASQVSDAGLAHLAKLTSLTYLDLAGTRITDAGLAHLEGLVILETLNLGALHDRLTDAGLKHLRPLTQLDTLYLTNATVSDAGLEHLRPLTQVRGLVLYDTRVSNAGLEVLRALPRLQYLGLGHTGVDDAGTERLRALTKLRSLDLSQTHLSDAGLARLAFLTDLEQLGLADTDVSDVGMAHVRKLTKLNSLNLARCGVTDAGLPHLYALAALRDLDLTGTKVTPAGVAALGKALPACRITGVAAKPEVSDRPGSAGDAERRAAEWVLSVGGKVGLAQNADDSISSITDLPPHPLVYSVKLENCRITDEMMANLEPLTRLQFLFLSQCRGVGDAGLAHVSRLKGLRVLSLNDTRTTDAGLDSVEGLPDLRELHLAGTRITDAGLLRLRTLTRLETLTISDTPVTDAGLTHLRLFKNLTRLNVSTSAITDRGIASLRALPKLQAVDLGGTRLTKSALLQLQECKGLRELCLDGNGWVDDDCLKVILKLKRIWFLSLRKTAVSDGGLKYLKALEELRHLSLCDTAVSDTGLAHVGELENLEFLDLSGSRVTDAGLESLRKLTVLRDLDLTRTRVTPEGAARLRKELPTCRIIQPTSK